ncbi:MAG: ATP-binding cassette domain-containing protein [Thermodesulfobacteriota bacterium]
MPGDPLFLEARPSAPPSGREVVVFEDVVKVYNGRRVLDGVSFTVSEGEYISLTGESMSGKTTIFKIIAGLVKPEQGRVTVFGRDIRELGERARRDLLKKIEMQFQSGALFDSMTVRENIMFVLDEETSLPFKEKEAVITRLLKGVNLLSAINKFPFELSGGMKKRVAVARALATTPELALFDEPAAGLDPVTSVRIVNLIKSLVAQYKMTLMAATTDVHTAMRFADRFLLLRNGRIHADASWTVLKDSGDEYTRRFLDRTLKTKD